MRKKSATSEPPNEEDLVYLTESQSREYSPLIDPLLDMPLLDEVEPELFQWQRWDGIDPWDGYDEEEEEGCPAR